MSFQLPFKHRRKSISASDAPYSSPSQWPPSSSPPSSSSPPPQQSSPSLLSDHPFTHTRNRGSSPPVFEIGLNISDLDQRASLWDLRATKPLKYTFSASNHNLSFSSDDEPSLSSDFDASDLSEDADTYSSHFVALPSLETRRTSRSKYFVPDNDEASSGMELGLIDRDARGTFFTVSAERGRWRNDPYRCVPYANRSQPTRSERSETEAVHQTCQVMPLECRLEDRLVKTTRTSTPSNSTRNPSPRLSLPPSSPLLPPSSPIQHPSPPSPLSSIQPLGSLPPNLPISPISTPPTLSLSPVSPLALISCIPEDNDVLNRIHPKTDEEKDIMSLDLDEEDCVLVPTSSSSGIAGVENTQTASMVRPEHSNVNSGEPDLPSDLSSTFITVAASDTCGPNSVSEDLEAPSVLTPTPTSESMTPSCIMGEEYGAVEVTVTTSSSKMSELGSGSITPVPLHDLAPDRDIRIGSSSKEKGESEGVLPLVSVVEGNKPIRVMKSGKKKEKETTRRKKGDKRKEVGVLDERQANTGRKTEDKSGVEGGKEKRKKGPLVNEEGPTRKKSRVFQEGRAVDMEGKERHRRKQSGDAKETRERRKVDRSEKEQHDIHKVGSGVPKQKSKRGDRAKVKPCQRVSSVTSTPNAATDLDHHSVSKTTTSDSPLIPSVDPPLPCNELLGMLIQCMVTSRASSLPLSSLYRLVMQSHPAVSSLRNQREWMTIIERVLEDGQKGCGVFGKVESSGTDDAGHALESQWFYIPEGDQDQERAALIKSMVPRPEKRSETKKYKQYYYRPLEKISRWDPEDEL